MDDLIRRSALLNDVEQLKQLSDDDLMRVRNLGRHSLEEIHEKLERHTMTNADHIRSMSDEELADKITDYINTCPGDEFADCKVNCKACWLKWLKQPYKENEE